MEKWTNEQAEKEGKALLEGCFEYCNSLFRYNNEENSSEVLIHELVEKIKSYTWLNRTQTKEEQEIIKHNYKMIEEDIEAVSKILEIVQIYLKAEKVFRSNNIAMIRVANMIVTTETRIDLEIEYNALLDAIPNDAKENIDKKLLIRKDVEKDKEELPSLEFLCGKFEQSFIEFFELPTFKYAELEICIFICKTIFKQKRNNKNIEIVRTRRNGRIHRRYKRL